MIIDTHVHFGGSHASYEIYTADSLLAIAEAAGTDRIVQVTPGSSPGHAVTTEQLEAATQVSLTEAKRLPNDIISVIARLDLLAADAPARLESLMRDPNVLGFRITSGNVPASPRILSEPRLQPVLAAAERLGAAVQIFAPNQLPEMTAIAKRYPAMRILVDHMALRFREDGQNANIFGEWPQLIEFAALPNVWIKVSYFPEAGIAFDPFPFPTAQRYFKELYERVGADKLMWGSNFPPVAAVCTYKESLDFVREHCTFLNATDRDSILGGTYLKHFGKKRA